jgi:hypothetical protein
VKKKIVLMLVFAFVFCLSIGAAHAATVSLVPTPQSVAPGGNFSFTLPYDFTSPAVGVLGGGVDLIFDYAVLKYQKLYLNATILSQVDASFSSDPVYVPLGAVNGWNFGSFSGLTGTGTIGTLNFQVDPLASIGASDNIAMSVSTTSGGWFDTDGNGITPTLNGATVNVVPIPGAIWLLGSGLIGLVGLNRRRKN